MLVRVRVRIRLGGFQVQHTPTAWGGVWWCVNSSEIQARGEAAQYNAAGVGTVGGGTRLVASAHRCTWLGGGQHDVCR